ncbi:ribosomal protein L17 [Bernardetia litoralis DSM 6794]|uniref:Large ribosomal subunit protein bL17 n=1 Tax=Bernardetia litoralis (strain ATCC 23117 / DSM 6794 / NBRC 15988 / NCIMB 1366 / Fx l1 / Sio-4) TaxID=880071 RepID=I4AN47_BERLS|nr:50S ribosomal protein L17 [Bernardetia litoralis]AFM05382.1 ribosomal protein L17 [Bernardetia litoralis DSM 6794]
MRHGKKFNHLGRTSSHRKAMLSNMAASLILHKRIQTTTAKAKALRKYVEPLITRSKAGTQNDQRVVFSYLQNKEATKELFNEVARKVGERPGGYTRIIKLSLSRAGDNSDVCFIELVDYNELMLQESSSTGRTRRGRRKKKKTSDDTTATASSEATAEQTEENKTDEDSSKEEN